MRVVDKAQALERLAADTEALPAGAPCMGCALVICAEPDDAHIASTEDGVVNWRDSIVDNPRVRHIEVRSTHVGMAHNFDVYFNVAQVLAESAGER